MFDFILGVVFPLKRKLCLGQIKHFHAGLGKLNESPRAKQRCTKSISLGTPTSQEDGIFNEKCPVRIMAILGPMLWNALKISYALNCLDRGEQFYDIDFFFFFFFGLSAPSVEMESSIKVLLCCVDNFHKDFNRVEARWQLKLDFLINYKCTGKVKRDGRSCQLCENASERRFIHQPCREVTSRLLSITEGLENLGCWCRRLLLLKKGWQKIWSNRSRRGCVGGGTNLLPYGNSVCKFSDLIHIYPMSSEGSISHTKAKTISVVRILAVSG